MICPDCMIDEAGCFHIKKLFKMMYLCLDRAKETNRGSDWGQYKKYRKMTEEHNNGIEQLRIFNG